MIALVFIFNHQFEANIPRLSAYYKHKFTKLNFIMPFYRGGQSDVIPVYEDPRTFSGHIAQAFPKFITKGVSHYLFLADDLILNPNLTEHNLQHHLGVRDQDGFIKSLTSLDRMYYTWPHAIQAVAATRRPSFDYLGKLAEVAGENLTHLWAESNPRRLFPRTLRDIKWLLRLFIEQPAVLAEALRSLGRRLPLPLQAGYSDFVLVPAAAVKNFAYYCGVFSAIKMFAEVAVPTALVLACESVRTELIPGEFFDAQQKTFSEPGHLHGLELWREQIPEFCARYEFRWAKLIAGFPESALYVHPIKLSLWT